MFARSASRADHEEISQALIEHQLGRGAGVRAAEDDCKGALTLDDSRMPSQERTIVGALHEPSVPRSQALQALFWRRLPVHR
jgi:hypothetical protein